MAAGLFELRKDPITGWWVATIVDRAFHRDRFARAAEPVDDRMFGCANCSTPAGDGVRVRMLKDFAFHVVGTGDEARELDAALAQVSLAQARATGVWRTIVAPPASTVRCMPSATTLIEALVGSARDALAEARATGQTDYLQVVQNWGAQAGARTNHLCLDLYDLPQIPHRIAEELGGAARFVIREGECPFCRLVRDEIAAAGPARLGGRRERGVRPVRVALAVRGLDRAAPPRGRLRPGDRHRHAATAEALRQVLGRLAASLDGPPYNLVLHTAPLREQVDAHLPLALGDPPATARDRRAGAGNRPAGQSRLPGGRRGGVAGPQRPGGRWIGLIAPCPSAPGVTSGGGRRLWPIERAPHATRAPRPHPARSLRGPRPLFAPS